MAAVTLGDIVPSKCGKCNDVTGHVVMAIVGGSIVKVECRACGSVHKYRPPDAPPRVRPEAPVRRGQDGTIIHSAPPRPAFKSAVPASGSRQPKTVRPSALYAQWQEVLRSSVLAPPLPYSVTACFTENSLLEHPVFGLGRVLSLVPPGKMDVLFEDGVKRLICG